MFFTLPLYFNYFSIGSLIAAAFNFVVALFFLFISKKSKATFHLGIAFLGMSGHAISFFASSYYHLDAAFHRWILVAAVLPGILHYTQFFFHYPKTISPRVAKGFLFTQWGISLLFTINYIIKTLQVDRVYNISGHYWAFDVAKLNSLFSVLVLLYAFIMLGAGIWRTIITGKKERWVVLGMTLSLAIVSIVPAVANALSREGAMDRGLFMTLYDLFTVLGFFFLVVIYINNTKDKTTFMAKIIGISLVTFLVVLQGLSYYSLKDREEAYDDIHREQVSRIVERDFKTSDIQYITTLTIDKEQFSHSYKKDKVVIDFESLEYEFLNTVIWRNIQQLPEQLSREDFINELKQLLNQSHVYFIGYKNAILQYVKLLQIEEQNPKQRIFEYLNGLERTILYSYNKISKLPNNDFRKALQKFLIKKGKKEKFIPFYNAITEHLKKSNHEGDILKSDVLKYLAVMTPAGTRHYRKDKETTHHYVSFMYPDLNSNKIHEVGFSYIGYRKYIHPAALKLIIMLGIILIIVIIGFRFFFLGALINPLTALLKGVGDVNKGNLDVVVPIKVEDEIGFLSRSFNGMVSSIKEAGQKLQDYADNLEEKVEERTEELKKAQGRVIELEKQATERQMAGGFAHEIRNALAGSELVLSQALGLDNPIESQASMILKNARRLKKIFEYIKTLLTEKDLKKVLKIMKEIFSTEDSLEKILQISHRSTSRGLLITQEIMDYSKIGQQKSSEKSVNIKHLLENIVNEANTEFNNQGINIKMSLYDKEEYITGNEMHFYSIFKNVLLNARDALIEKSLKDKDDKVIKVTSKKENDKYIIAINDNGIGIHPENKDKIFDAFFSTKPETGTGLGLGMVKKIINIYKGTIDFKSALGKGTTFNITLPIIVQ
ncbi:MAG: GHKL domain-containing protein [Spirochaetes bacterium]|nr:GHKL domain-containing protein [Spirochaetota bacterium]